MTDYYEKYIKYKTKYQRMKDNCIKYNYYFIHGTRDVNNLKSILHDGFIYPGKDVDIKRRFQSGGQPMDDIYANIYFDDLRNLDYVWDYAIILHPQLLYEYNTTFNKAWGGKFGRIHINKADNNKTISTKLRHIRNFFKNPNALPETFNKFPEYFKHEVVFINPDPIPLMNNLLGIICNKCSQSQIKELHRIARNNGYPDIKIISSSDILPTLDELL